MKILQSHAFVLFCLKRKHRNFERKFKRYRNEKRSKILVPYFMQSHISLSVVTLPRPYFGILHNANLVNVLWILWKKFSHLSLKFLFCPKSFCEVMFLPVVYFQLSILVFSFLGTDDSRIQSGTTYADREHRKWIEKAVPLQNNPYSKESLEKRLSRTSVDSGTSTLQSRLDFYLFLTASLLARS